MELKFLDASQNMIGKLPFDNRDTALDFGPFPVKDLRKVPPVTAKRRVLLPTRGFPAANTNRVLGLQTTPNIAMVVQGIEALVHGQSSNADPSGLLFGNGTQLSEISRRPPAGMLTEDQKRFVFDQNDVFDEPPVLPFLSGFHDFSLIPKAAEVMRTSVGQAVAGTVAQGIAASLQGLFQVLEKIQKQLFDGLFSKPLVKLLKCRIVRTLREPQKFLNPGIAQHLFFGFSIRPFIPPSQKQQSQMLTLPISFLGKLVRVIFNDLLAKLKAYQDKLFVACQLFHEKLLLSQRSLSGGAFRLFQATN